MEELINKGIKKAYLYFLNRGYSEYGYYQYNGGNIAEFYKAAAGVTVESIRVHFNQSNRVVSIETIRP